MRVEQPLYYQHDAYSLDLGAIIHHTEFRTDSLDRTHERKIGSTLLTRIEDDASLKKYGFASLDMQNSHHIVKKTAETLELLPLRGLQVLVRVLDKEFKNEDKVEHIFLPEDISDDEGLKSKMTVLDGDTTDVLSLHNGSISPEEFIVL